jgi:hypothetical protein
LQIPRLEVLDQNIATRHKIQQQLAAGRLREIDGQRLLAAVDADVGRGVLARHTFGIFQERRRLAHLVAGTQTLDLVHRGTHVGQRLGTPRAGKDPGQVQHFDVGKNLRRTHSTTMRACIFTSV